MSYICPEKLSSFDQEPVSVFNPFSEVALVLLADHSGNFVPDSMDSLGLDIEILGSHIALDIGVYNLVRKLSWKLGATSILANYTRLLIDTNRPLSSKDSIVRVSDSVEIPANLDLTEQERRKRAELFYFPFHQKVFNKIMRLIEENKIPIIISVHSFTRNFSGIERPWDIGIMTSENRSLGEGLIGELKTGTNFLVGDNEPYSGLEFSHTLDIHAVSQGLSSVQIEICQDLLADDYGIDKWVGILFRIFNKILIV